MDSPVRWRLLAERVLWLRSRCFWLSWRLVGQIAY
jgi:hypothetical protein